MAEYPPDLKVLLVTLAQEVNAVHSWAITAHEIGRIQDATNLPLVLSRVLMSLAKRHGVTQDAVLRVVAKARNASKPTTEEMFEAAPLDEAKTSTRKTDWDIIAEVDDALLKHRDDVPSWFVDDYWPGCLRRCAQGHKMSDRERDITQYVTSVARGER